MGSTGFALRQGERLLMSGAANKWQTIGSKGGKLLLTNQRIVFQAHAFNFGSNFDEYELSEIQTQGNTVNIKTTSNLVSFNISFYTKSGEKLSFVVTRSQKNEWIRQITAAVASYDCSAVSVPENISEAEIHKNIAQNTKRPKIAAQTKVIQCEGCGAFITVTAGSAVKCDYCDRPITLY